MVPKWLYSFIVMPVMYEVSSCSTSLATLGYVQSSFTSVVEMDKQWYIIVVWSCISPISIYVEHFFMFTCNSYIVFVQVFNKIFCLFFHLFMYILTVEKYMFFLYSGYNSFIRYIFLCIFILQSVTFLSIFFTIDSWRPKVSNINEFSVYQFFFFSGSCYLYAI